MSDSIIRFRESAVDKERRVREQDRLAAGSEKKVSAPDVYRWALRRVDEQKLREERRKKEGQLLAAKLLSRLRDETAEEIGNEPTFVELRTTEAIVVVAGGFQYWQDESGRLYRSRDLEDGRTEVLELATGAVLTENS